MYDFTFLLFFLFSSFFFIFSFLKICTIFDSLHACVYGVMNTGSTLSSTGVLVILLTRENGKEPLPYNICVMVPVVFRDFIILFSQSTSWSSNRMQKKIAHVLIKILDLKPLSRNKGN